MGSGITFINNNNEKQDLEQLEKILGGIGQHEILQVKDKQEKEEKEWAEKLERERARTLNKVQ